MARLDATQTNFNNRETLLLAEIAHAQDSFERVKAALLVSQSETADARKETDAVRRELEGAVIELGQLSGAMENKTLDCIIGHETLLRVIQENERVSLEIQSRSGELQNARSDIDRLTNLLNDLEGRYRLAESERHRLFDDLELDGGPMALRLVLPIAKLMRPLIRRHGKFKRLVRSLFH